MMIIEWQAGISLLSGSAGERSLEWKFIRYSSGRRKQKITSCKALVKSIEEAVGRLSLLKFFPEKAVEAHGELHFRVSNEE